MDKEKFEEFHQEHVKEWQRLAETGDTVKSDYVSDNFKHGCPACEVAVLTRIVVEGVVFDKGCHRNVDVNCRYCPITIWREEAIGKNTSIGAAECLQGVFGNWDELACNSMESGTEEEDAPALRRLAQQILDLEWSWIPEYERTEVISE